MFSHFVSDSGCELENFNNKELKRKERKKRNRQQQKSDISGHLSIISFMSVIVVDMLMDVLVISFLLYLRYI